MSRASRKPPPRAALTRAQGEDVLRYWLATLRLEEALQARPAARQTAAGGSVPRLDQPTPAQGYFKLPLDAALAAVLTKEATITRPFDAELCGFFETWLHGQYRRSEDEGELSHLLCFPVVHLPKGELAGLLRCGVRLRFGSGAAAPFRTPTRAERQRGAYPTVPDEVRMNRAARADGAWPFFIDTRLLRQPLGVPAESIDALYEALRGLETVSETQMLSLLVVMLEDAAHAEQQAVESGTALAARFQRLAAERLDVDAWLERVVQAVRGLLSRRGARAKVYPVGIVVDGAQAKTTWHLQRELNALLLNERGRWQVDSPLGAYVTGKKVLGGAEPQRALFPGPALTASQRAAAETFWGSSFSAVQGPPGTGKTRLILHLAAEHLVRQVEALLGLGADAPGQLLITSSNNRAVDNVIQPLSGGEGLPLALRAGSRQACEHQLAVQLRRARSWLARAETEPALERSARLVDARAELQARRAELERALAPRRAADERAAQRARLEQELADASSAEELAAGLPAKAQAHLLLFALESLQNRLRRLSQLCEAPAVPASLGAIERHFQRTAKRQLPALQEALDDASLTLELPLPPSSADASDLELRLETWEDATELALVKLAELRASLEEGVSAMQRVERAGLLRAQLEALGPEPVNEPTMLAPDEALSRQLFEAAVVAREAWAKVRAAALLDVVSSALRAVEDERSLRPFCRGNPEAAQQLFRLFGVWGATLLSLGNFLPNDLGGVARVVIDEAGQCHPAHAVSALLRAESALVIGDVHQLSPVFELGVDDEARLLRSCRLATPIGLLEPYRVHQSSEVSTQSLADRAVAKRGTLTDHFRCQGDIIALSDELCGYGLTVHTPRASRERSAPYLAAAVSLVDLRGEQARLGGSWYNELELRETITLVEDLLQRGVAPAEIAVITPYRGQLERLRRGLLERRVPLEQSAELSEGGTLPSGNWGLALGTVHRFQGGERSIVLLTSVVTHPGSLPFLNARPNLLNVAISRAQHHLVCLGHAQVLSDGTLSRLLTERATALSPTAYGGAGE